MRKPFPPYDITDLSFRVLFSLIFLGLGLEHLFDDALIRTMMPDWLGSKRLLSVGAGATLIAGGATILLGYRLRAGATLLAAFLVVVTLVVHVPALFSQPEDLAPGSSWLWDLYQRSNLMKNLCLLGGCIHLVNHRLGRFSLEARTARLASDQAAG